MVVGLSELLSDHEEHQEHKVRQESKNELSSFVLLVPLVFFVLKEKSRIARLI
jgi:hypothetical protein